MDALAILLDLKRDLGGKVDAMVVAFGEVVGALEVHVARSEELIDAINEPVDPEKSLHTVLTRIADQQAQQTRALHDLVAAINRMR